jgi:predicted ATPase/DNA-binding SARP family transcriptional activator
MSPSEPSGIVFGVLGPLRVEGPQQEIRIGGVRRRGVLLRLLSSPGRLVPTEVLVEDVWDGDPPAAAGSTLQSHVSALRQAIGTDRLIFGDGGYRVQAGPGELDSLMFEADVAVGRAAMAAGRFGSAADALERALGRWRGRAFADVLESGWSVLAAGHLEQVRNTAVEEALEARLALGGHDEVCVLAEEAVAAEPLRERRWAALMLALYRAGRQAEALAIYRRLHGTLAEQLGIDPSPRLSQLHNDILTQSPRLNWVGTADGVARISALPSPAPTAPGNLPTPVASFIGRARELAELSELVAHDRLVTITGTGGVGKTRLAIEVAASALGEYRDGVWFVDLAELSDPAGVAAAVADAIGLRQVTGQPVAKLLAERVARMHALLVVDNCEHLVDAAATTVEQILEAGAGMRVVATSRQPLRVPGERVWQTPPISFPDILDLRDPAGLLSFDAIQLFINRASPLATAGAVSSADVRVIAHITAQLEGIPLAIELAAARAAHVGLRQLTSALHDRITLSWLGSRTAHIRQQTLAATIGWSYDLLTAELQSALKALAVFSGGFTLEAAAAVAGGIGNVAETVASLVERCLIEAGRSGRYRMLETVRQYCAARAADEAGTEAVTTAKAAHSRYFVSLARQASAALTGWHQGRWLTRLEADHANLITAVSHLLTPPVQADQALQMIVDLDRFWRYRGHESECADLLQRGLAAADRHVPAAVRCGALNLAGNIAGRHDLQAGRMYLAESLQVAQAARDDYHTTEALRGLAYGLTAVGDIEGGSAAGKSAVELARSVGDPVLLGDCLLAYGFFVSDPAERTAVYQEALAVTRRSGDRINTAWSHSDLGNWALVEDNLEAARQQFEQARAIFLEVGNPNPQQMVNLGWVYLRSGDPAAADAAFIDALNRFERLHLRHDASYAILALACSAAAQSDWERAARLLGFADAEHQDSGASWYDPERTYRREALAEIQHQLGPNFDRHYDSGRASERSNLIELALNQHSTP